MPAVLRRLGARAHGGDIADGPPVRGARSRTAALRRGLGAPRAGRRVGARVGLGRARLGPGAASGGVGVDAGDGGAWTVTGGVRGARRRGARRSGSKPFTSADFEIEKL
jgi:hypothetical protein